MLNFNQSNSKDAELGSAISRMISGMASGLHVSAEAGHVTISGMVDDFGTKRDISAAVQGMGGVKTLSNCIRVTPIGD